MYLLKLQVQIISGNKEYQDPANRFMQYYHTHLNGEPTNKYKRYSMHTYPQLIITKLGSASQVKSTHFMSISHR